MRRVVSHEVGPVEVVVCNAFADAWPCLVLLWPLPPCSIMGVLDM